MTFKPNINDVILNKYQIVSLVGEGAFGCVYRARDVKLDRIVALKFLHAEGGVLERFADELDAIKNLDHPNIVRLYDYDILKGSPCIVMEFVNGREIGDILCDDGTFDTLRIGEITLQVLDALVETHKHDIVHCDLKPENIMLTSVGARKDVVKLIDFGVASILSKTSDDRQKTLVGTPQYMAPEQIRHEAIGPWTDIYAVGLIMIELFTGQFVFDHDDPREVLRMQLYSPVQLPPALGNSVLGPIIRRATAKDTNERYRSTQEFYDDISEATQILQTEAREKRDKKGNVSRNRAVSSLFYNLDDISDPPANISESLNSISSHPLNLSIKRERMSDSSRGSSRPRKEDSGLHASQVPLLNSSNIPPEQPKSENALQPRASKASSKEEINLGLDLSSLQNSIGDLSESNQSLKDGKRTVPEPEPPKPVSTPSTPVVETTSQPSSPSLTPSRPNLSLTDEVDGTQSQPIIPKTVEVVESNLSASNIKTASKKDFKAVPQKKSALGTVLAVSFILLFLVVGVYYCWHSGMLESILSQYGISTPDVLSRDDPAPAPAPKIEEQPPTPKPTIRFSTIRDTASTMAYVAAFSSASGNSATVRKYKPYRVIGTPMDAKIYLNNSLVCSKTPCNVNIYGEPAKSKMEIRYRGQSNSADLSKQDPNLPVILVLK